MKFREMNALGFISSHSLPHFSTYVAQSRESRNDLQANDTKIAIIDSMDDSGPCPDQLRSKDFRRLWRLLLMFDRDSGHVVIQGLRDLEQYDVS